MDEGVNDSLRTEPYVVATVEVGAVIANAPSNKAFVPTVKLLSTGAHLGRFATLILPDEVLKKGGGLGDTFATFHVLMF